MKETLNEQQQLELHHVFPPRFFSVRPDLLVIEFLRTSVINLTDCVIKEGSVKAHAVMVNTVSTHTEEVSALYMKYEPMTKLQCSGLLKQLHIPSQKKKKGEADEIGEEEQAKAEDS
jgi:hypothetical protein